MFTDDFYEIKGIWSGPKNSTGDHTKLIHLEYTRQKDTIEFVEYFKKITFGDGTIMQLMARCFPNNEQFKEEILTYARLIRQCVYNGVNIVDDLPKDG